MYIDSTFTRVNSIWYNCIAQGLLHAHHWCNKWDADATVTAAFIADVTLRCIATGDNWYTTQMSWRDEIIFSADLRFLSERMTENIYYIYVYINSLKDIFFLDHLSNIIFWLKNCFFFVRNIIYSIRIKKLTNKIILGYKLQFSSVNSHLK